MRIITAQEAVFNNVEKKTKFESFEPILQQALDAIIKASYSTYELELETRVSNIVNLARDLTNLGYTVEQISNEELYISWFPSQTFK